MAAVETEVKHVREDIVDVKKVLADNHAEIKLFMADHSTRISSLEDTKTRWEARIKTLRDVAVVCTFICSGVWAIFEYVVK